jgi:hypothetical protein
LDELRSRLIIILGVLGVGVSLCFWRSGEIFALLRGTPDFASGWRSAFRRCDVLLRDETPENI